MTLSRALKRPSVLGAFTLIAAFALGASPAGAHTFVAVGVGVPLVFPPPVVYGPPVVYAPPPVVYGAPAVIYPAPAVPVYVAPPQYYPGEWPGLDIFTRR